MKKGIEMLVQVLAVAWSCSPRAVNPTNRGGNGLLKRFVAVQVLTEEGYSPMEISAYFGLNRYNIMYALRSFADLIETNREVKQLYLMATKAVEDLDDDDQAIERAV